MQQQEQAVPVLRFPEFDGKWCAKELRALSSIYDGTHQTPDYTASGVPFVSVEDIGDLESTSKFISEEDFERDFRNSPRKGDVLMTRITAGIIGATNVIKNDRPLAYYVSLALIRPRKELDANFLSLNISTFHFRRELHRRIIHVAFPKKINLGDIGHCEVVFPPIEEQKKIAAFLGAVDEKIAQLQQKRGLLEEYKKGCTQKLFSQELRFMDGDGRSFPDWDEKTVGKLGKVVGGGTPETTKEQFWNGGIQWFTPTELKQKYVSSSDRTITEAGLKNSSAKLLPLGTVLLSTRATVGDVSIAERECATNQGFQSLVVGNRNYNEFCYYLLTTQKKQIIRKACGSTFLEINKKEVEKLPVKVPHPDEQQRIADFLSAIDDKIALVAEELDKAKTFKKGLLQQMFV